MTNRPGARTRRLAQVAALGVALGLLFGVSGGLLSQQPASAHAYIVSSTPGNGAELAAAPTTVRVSFDEPVTLPGTADEATVLDSAGRRVDTGAPNLSADRTTLTIGIKPGIAKDSYIASWSVVSADTHPVGGSIEFGYGVPATAAAAPEAPQPSAVLSLLVGLAKGLLYLALVVGLGVPPAALLLGAAADERRTVLRVARVGAAVAAAASVLQLGLQHLWESGALATFATSSYAIAVYARIVALGIAAAVAGPAAADRPRRTARAVFAAAGLAAVGTVVVNGHGGSHAWWYFASTALHAISAVAWLGGLAVLGWLLLRGRLSAERLRRMPHWSLYAGASVAALALSGVVQGLVEVRYPAALVTTQYGGILIIKLALVAGVLALAVRGHFWVRRETHAARAAASAQPAPGRTAVLRNRVRWEAGIAASVVVASGVLSSITPAAADYAPTVTQHEKIGPYRVTLEVSPTRTGPETLKITVLEPSFNAALPDALDVSLSQAGGPVKSLAVDFPYRLAGVVHPGKPTPVTFTSAAVTVPRTGEWTASITVVASALEQYTADLHYRVQ
ncbi:copper resistance CopC/CopD family protein [Gryllotalpicola koreensis]|uniref:Copper resistance protein CopC n=1 Tax=Gryllotalpicola koreensis TaxID=993086 RepID=A0ABP8A679_9MICO